MSVSDIVRLRIYNDAIRLMGGKRLSGINEKTETRRILDDAWEQDPVRYLLEKALWKFARRTVSVEADDAIEIVPGWEYGFRKPEDMARVAEVGGDEYFAQPLLHYKDEGEYWFSNIDTIYVSYVSFDGDYGYNTSLWPKTFERCLAAYLASQCVNRETKEGLKLGEGVDRLYRKLLNEAKATDAQAGPTRFLPEGRFVQSRGYGSRRRRDHGTGGPY